MLVPATLTASWSPSPAKVPPMIFTVALARFWLSGSATEAAPDSVTAAPFSVKVAPAAMLDSVGASFVAVMPTVVVTVPSRCWRRRR